MAADSIVPSDSPLGYERDEELQAAFLGAAAELCEADGWPDPHDNNRPRLVADLALEGGGVKGIALVGAVLVLSEAGYSFRGIAGTSAGAITASLVASISAAGREMIALRGYMDSLTFSKFMPEGKLHQFLDHHLGKVGGAVADVSILSRQMGLYSGDYLTEWLAPIIHNELGITSFKDLRLSAVDDPDLSLPPGHDYRLVVHTSDITRGQLVRLPWDYPFYGHQPDHEDPVAAVRASMSIPFFFEPVHFEAEPATVGVPHPGGGTTTVHYEGGSVTWVDGGMLDNFPITAFDRVDGKPPRWPTIGMKLSSLQTEFPATRACGTAVDEGVRCLQTMMNEWDSYSIDESTAGRTIFIDNDGIGATDFDLSMEQQHRLFINGVTAATDFIIEMAHAGGVPRSADEARRLVLHRRGLPIQGGN
jgi:NTE family protein